MLVTKTLVTIIKAIKILEYQILALIIRVIAILRDKNSGSFNVGFMNSGFWNIGDMHAGYFNIASNNLNVTSGSHTIMAFDKPCELSDWNAAYKPRWIYPVLAKWIFKEYMTEQMKNENTYWQKLDGFLFCHKNMRNAFALKYKLAYYNDKQAVKNLPNFDSEIFYEITGIDLNLL